MASRPISVLFVEDDGVLAMVVSRHLRARGHDARTVAWAEEVAELLKSGFRPSLVLLDINLPGASGWDLLRSGVLTAAGSPPVYVVSATTIAPARLREFGIAGFLPKPFPMETLVDIVERAAEGSDRSTEVLEDPMATPERRP